MSTLTRKAHRQDTCFLCLSSLNREKEKRRGQKKKNQPNFTIAFKYLLADKGKRYDSLLESILHSIQSGPRSSVKVCSNCESSLQRMTDLHVELEVIQMKLVDILKCVRKTVIEASPIDNHEQDKGDAGDGAELENLFENTQTNPRRYKKSEILKVFQKAVIKTDQDSDHIPLVYLERCTNFKPVPPEKRNNCTLDTAENLTRVKSEPILGENFDDVFEDLDYFPEEDNGSFTMETNVSTLVGVKLEAEKPIRPRKRTAKFPPSSVPTSTKKIKVSKVEKVTDKINTKKKKPPLRRKLKFACERCPLKINRFERSHIEHHLQRHETDEKTFKCPECPNHQGFSQEQLFNLHMTYHKLTTQCVYCEEKIIKIQLADHYLTHSDVGTVYRCPLCLFCSTSQEKYITHILRRSATTFECYLCPEKFHSRAKILTHLHDVHHAIEKLNCDIVGCSESFLNKTLLDIHKRTHGNTFFCQQCGKMLSNAGSYQRHLSMHTGDHPYKCSLCPEGFNTKMSLQTHQIRKHGAPKHQCDQCDKSFTTVSFLRSHVESVHQGVQYPCDYCDLVFDSQAKRKRHRYSHTAPDKLNCPVCGKKFNLTEAVHRHMLIHSGEKKFQCSYCPKAFVCSKYLADHVRTHTGEKPYICDFCGKGFSQFAGLYLHKKSQHKRELEVKAEFDSDPLS